MARWTRGCTPLGEAENGKRIAEFDSGTAKTTSGAEVRKRNSAKLPKALIPRNFMRKPRPTRMRHSTSNGAQPAAALKFDTEMDRALTQIL
jgi:hypothetical protein